MGSYGHLLVGSLEVTSHRNGVDNELLALFRDDMLHIDSAMASEYYTAENGYSDADDAAPTDTVDDEIITLIYKSPGHVITDRLDLMGATPEVSESFLDVRLRERGYSACPSNGRAWIEALQSASDDDGRELIPAEGTKRWLVACVDCSDYIEERYLLRCVLLSFPGAIVTLDVTDLNQSGYLDEFPRFELMSSEASRTIRSSVTNNSSVVVLTEGRTDAEFLSNGLQIIYPHLTDLVRFLDFDQKVEGSAGALVRMIRAFSAAGIANRVVAVFDNDTAAADAMKSLDLNNVAANVRIIQYPQIELAKRYPTLGPPTLGLSSDPVSVANVNGLAGSIELYLGPDVLRKEDGALQPIQWKSYIEGMKRYQGEVIDKAGVQKRFRDKVRRAIDNPAVVPDQDWQDMRKVLDVIRSTARTL